MALRIALGFFMIFQLLKAEQIEISSKSFYANEAQLKSEFNGDVLVKRANDELRANKAIVYFDKKRQPLRYEAIGNAKFKAILKGKRYSGSGDKLVYDAINETYTIIGNGHLKELDGDKNVYGQKIVINQKNGTYNVEGGDTTQPVRFIFNVQDKKDR
nr:lipopolysaccharide transport periplasmic protein LptA [Campylobacter sp. 19-13652]